jgi:Fe-S-cluster containining protein
LIEAVRWWILGYGVALGPEDAALIAEHTGQGEVTRVTNNITDFDCPEVLENYTTRRNDNGCVFLEPHPETNEVHCAIHPVRPPACRGYAPEIDREACLTGLKRRWNLEMTSAEVITGNESELARFYHYLKANITG